MNKYQNSYGYTITDIGDKNPTQLSWIFVPGGPGFNSSYLLDLVLSLQLEGNRYLIDYPENPNQLIDNFVPTIKTFQNPVIVGHSFGSMIVMMLPELQHIIKGLVILNSSPVLWYNPKQIDQQMISFINNPNKTNFDKVLGRSLIGYFNPYYLNIGFDMVSNIPSNYTLLAWWFLKSLQINYHYKWIPSFMVLIIMGQYDKITPIQLWYDKNRQFLWNKSNITVSIIPNSGHFPWIENFRTIKYLIECYQKNILNNIHLI